MKKRKNKWTEGCNARVGDSWANSVEAIVSFLEHTCGDTHMENREGRGGGEHCQRLNGYNVDFIVGLMKRHYATELRENGYKARDAVSSS